MIAITGKIIKKIDINLLLTKDSPRILKISKKSIPATRPVTIPDTITTANTSSFNANPITIITIPINVIYCIVSSPFKISRRFVLYRNLPILSTKYQ